ncbi:MAG: MerR family transcriptional regulator [Catenulispora sp.]|nr:MerR family transcriptional regulator [Catenulispora sp.]
MRIGELAQRTGVDEQLLRYYEKQGLLAPRRSGNGYRDYAESDVSAVRKIRALLAAGLSTATIAEVGVCLRDDTLPTPACSGVVRRLQGELDRIDRGIEELRHARAVLADVIERGDGAAKTPVRPAHPGVGRAADARGR